MVSGMNGLTIQTDMSTGEIYRLHMEWSKEQKPDGIVLALTVPSLEGHRPDVYINVDAEFAEYLHARGHKFTVLD